MLKIVKRNVEILTVLYILGIDISGFTVIWFSFLFILQFSPLLPTCAE
jgi:hypothetical protein